MFQNTSYWFIQPNFAMKLDMCIAKKPCVMTSFPYKEIELDIKIDFELKLVQNLGKFLFLRLVK